MTTNMTDRQPVMESYSSEGVNKLDGVLDSQGVLEVTRTLAPSRHVVLGHLSSQKCNNSIAKQELHQVPPCTWNRQGLEGSGPLLSSEGRQRAWLQCPDK